MQSLKSFTLVALALALCACGASSGSTGSTGGSVSAANVCAAGAWNTTGSPFFDTYCNGCHSFTSDTEVQYQSGSISSVISSGQMPPFGAGSPSSADRNAILQWLGCGAPQ